MSLILDALRKSEHERQREAGPALSVVPESPPARQAPRWLPALVVLLALNAVVLALVLLRDPVPDTTASTPPVERPAVTQPQGGAAADSAAPAAAGSPDIALELPTKPPRAEVRPLTTELPSRPAAAPAPEPAQAASPPRQQAARGPATPAASPAAQEEADAQLPRFADLVVRGELNVPHMHLDIHVYSGDPAQRFVFINMKRYNEGAATAEGPRVERIVPNGVVMDHRGQRFLLTRD